MRWKRAEGGIPLVLFTFKWIIELGGGEVEFIN